MNYLKQSTVQEAPHWHSSPDPCGLCRSDVKGNDKCITLPRALLHSVHTLKTAVPKVIAQVSGPFRVFQHMGEKSGWPGPSDDVWMWFEAQLRISTHSTTQWVWSWICLVTSCVDEWAEIQNHASNCIQLRHQIDQAFPNFLVYVEKHGETWVRGYQVSIEIEK